MSCIDSIYTNAAQVIRLTGVYDTIGEEYVTNLNLEWTLVDAYGTEIASGDGSYTAGTSGADTEYTITIEQSVAQDLIVGHVYTLSITDESVGFGLELKLTARAHDGCYAAE